MKTLLLIAVVSALLCASTSAFSLASAAYDDAKDRELRERAESLLLQAMGLPPTTKMIRLEGTHEGSDRHAAGACSVEIEIGKGSVSASPQLLISSSDLLHRMDQSATSVNRSWGGTVELHRSGVYHGTKECNIFCTGTNVTSTSKESLSIKMGPNGQPESYTHYSYKRTREMSWLGKVPLGVPSWESKSESVLCKDLHMSVQ